MPNPNTTTNRDPAVRYRHRDGTEHELIVRDTPDGYLIVDRTARQPAGNARRGTGPQRREGGGGRDRPRLRDHSQPAQLRSPVRSLTLAEIAEQHDRVFQLERGGAIRVYTNDVDLGVLTRDRSLLDEADLAHLIRNGTIPPLDQLLEMDDRGELPFGPYRDWQPRRQPPSKRATLTTLASPPPRLA